MWNCTTDICFAGLNHAAWTIRKIARMNKLYYNNKLTLLCECRRRQLFNKHTGLEACLCSVKIAEITIFERLD